LCGALRHRALQRPRGAEGRAAHRRLRVRHGRGGRPAHPPGAAPEDRGDGRRRRTSVEISEKAHPMRSASPLFTALLLAAPAAARNAAPAATELLVKRDLPYAEPAQPRQVLDVYAP